EASGRTGGRLAACPGALDVGHGGKSVFPGVTGGPSPRKTGIPRGSALEPFRYLPLQILGAGSFLHLFPVPKIRRLRNPLVPRLVRNRTKLLGGELITRLDEVATPDQSLERIEPAVRSEERGREELLTRNR